MDNALFLKETLEKETGVVFDDSPSLEDLQKALAIHINDLIVNNFEKLVFLLYRIDISEKKVKILLQNAKNTAAGETIAKAIIERQIEKINLRQMYTPYSNPSAEEDKW